jgi:spoIIIJ-associated protein
MMDQQIQRAKEWLETLLELIGLPASVIVKEGDIDLIDANACWLVINEKNLTPQQIEILIGYKGEKIDAIQYLLNASLNLGLEPEKQRAFTVELANYRSQRQGELLAWVKEVAEQVRRTGQEMEMKSLSSVERRQIHTFLQNVDDLETESRGQDPDRRLVVRLR